MNAFLAGNLPAALHLAFDLGSMLVVVGMFVQNTRNTARRSLAAQKDAAEFQSTMTTSLAVLRDEVKVMTAQWPAIATRLAAVENELSFQRGRLQEIHTFGQRLDARGEERYLHVSRDIERLTARVFDVRGGNHEA